MRTTGARSGCTTTRPVEIGQEFFGPLGERVDATMAEYDERELQLVERFLGSVAQAMADHRRSLEEPGR